MTWIVAISPLRREAFSTPVLYAAFLLSLAVPGSHAQKSSGVEIQEKSNYSKRLGRSSNQNGGLNVSVCVHVCFPCEDCVQAIWSTDQMGKEITFPFVDE